MAPRVACFALLVAGCLPPVEPLQPPAAPEPVAVAAPIAPQVGAPRTTASLVPVDVARGEGPRKRLTLAEARRYMVQLINRDRASMGLPPVELDEGAPTQGGQAHA